MALIRALVNWLEGLRSEQWSGIAYRHMLGDYDPLSPNRRGARWNPPDIDALYLSAERDTAVSEGDYLISLQSPPITPKRVLYRVDISLKSVLQLTDRALLRELGVDDAALTDADHQKCRDVGHAAAFLEHDGILVPSARSRGVNLVVFVNNQAADPGVLDAEILHDPMAKK